MATSNRIITDEQFSSGTTVDGDRIEKALEQTTSRYNNLPVDSIYSMTSKQLFWSYSPAMGVNPTGFAMGDDSGFFYKYWQHPILETYYDGLFNREQYIDTGNFPTQNSQTYAGVGKNRLLNYQDGYNNVEYRSRWENTYYTKKPVIIKELSFMGMWDDGYQYYQVEGSPPTIIAPLTDANKYFKNRFYDDDIDRQFQVLLVVDNNLNLDDTTSRTTELRVFRVAASNFMIAPWGNPTDTTQGLTFNKWSSQGATPICGYPDIQIANFLTLKVSYVPAGIHIQLKDLEIPIHEYSRIKVVLVYPKYPDSGATITANSWNQSNTTGDPDHSYTTPVPLTNLWSCSMTILEELEK